MQKKLYRHSNGKGAKERQKTAFISVKNRQVNLKSWTQAEKISQRILSCGHYTYIISVLHTENVRREDD